MNPHVQILCLGNVVLHQPSAESLVTTLEAVTEASNQPRYSPLRHEPGRFLKLNADGIVLPVTAKGHVIVRDLATDLEWLVEHATNEAVAHAAAIEAAEAVTVGGYTNWRLPLRPELDSIVDLSRYNPAIDTDFFPGTHAAGYWTASPDASDPEYAWLVYFNYGSANLNPRNYHGFVRAVRSVSSASPRQ